MKQDAIFGMNIHQLDVHQEPPESHGHCVKLSRPSLSKLVQKPCARCVLDASCTTVILGVVGSDCVFACAPCIWEDVGAHI